MIDLPIWLVVVAAASVALLRLISESKVDKDIIEKWVGICAPPDKNFCFKYAKKKYWGSREYLARKIVRLIKEEVEVESFDGSKTILPLQDLKQFQHPYQDIGSLRIVPSNPEVEQGQTVEFSAEATNYHKNSRTISADKFIWNAAGGHFDESKYFRQKYHATQKGAFTVRVSLGSFSAETKVIVKEPPRLHELLISPQNITLELDEERTLKLTAKDQYGHSFKVNQVEWTERTFIYQNYGTTAPVIIPSLSDNATSLKFQAKRPGNFLITAKSGGIEGKTTITVRETRRVSNIRIEPVRVNLEIGQSQRFTVEAKDQYDEKINIKSINWQVSRGEIDRQGNFLAQESGQVTITAAIDNIEATAIAMVKEPRHLTALVIEPCWAEMQVGQSQRFTVEGRDQFEKWIKVEQIDWQASLGQIDQNGVFRATEPGKCIVTARSGAIRVQAQVAANPVPQVFPTTLIDRKDPVTRSLFRAGEIAYCCMRCQLGHHEDSWAHLAQKCSNCKSDRDVNVYQLPGEFLGQANQYASRTVDLRSLQGKNANGVTSIGDALNSICDVDDWDHFRIEYSEVQDWGSRELEVRRVRTVTSTEIEVEDSTGNIRWLPIALLLAIVAVPSAVKIAGIGAIGGIVIWSLFNYTFEPSHVENETPDQDVLVSDANIDATDVKQLLIRAGNQVTVKGKIQRISITSADRAVHFYFGDHLNSFYAYIPPNYRKNFPDSRALYNWRGKEIVMSGIVIAYENQDPHIILRSSSQLQNL
ncbi:hypothetical protein [Trichocoleus sp. FACHB-262]|uniref:Ig-like domain-containing protein n=1 Tax=Trichocoleus sp. FACHB-262 TaxID=2692869 RepID=UPI00168A315C|nr:hypothetical protein [Trichocoleus sp. FACHB-262]MBD2122213.1 hypothetical protein [Trichocoleus sp. FACHB-262]